MRSLSFILVASLFAATCALAQSPHGKQLKIDCASCHVPTSWKIDPSKMTFDHNTETSFRLDGQHASIACVSCHKSLVFSGAKSTCNSCHRDVHQNSLGPDCAGCHSTKSWLVVDVNEMHQSTRFPLVGAHQNVDCASCHSGYSRLYFPPINVACITCHTKDYYATMQPNHIQAGFSTRCQQCHNVIDVSWGPTNFNHDIFPLVGGHAIQNCFVCHKQGTSDFSGLSTDCYSCHKADFMSVAFPNHVSGGFSTNCKTCHTINGWSPATFDHATTGFALTGAHASVQCASCHKEPTAKLSTDCYSCHSNDFASTTSPPHVSGGFPHACIQCHSTVNWSGATFDHSTTGFPLTGEHAKLQCAQCHASGYTNTPIDCYSCHTNDYSTATAPVNHVAAGLPHTCENCHTTAAPFTTSSFNHSTTGFALTGAHTSTACQSCHKGSVTAAPTDCYSCHNTDYAATTNPSHVQQGFPHTCDQCHSTISWSGATFDHSTTGFPLTGAHTSLQCAQCHTNGYTTPPPTDCYSCHSASYNNTTDPNHVQQGFSHTCTQCHNTSSWGDATFDHSTTGFPLTGAHTTVLCNQCHTNGYTTSPPTDCYTCHTTDYNSTTNPRHASAGYPTTCTQCHTTTAWSPSTFNHTQFPITSGNHAAPPLLCSQCHTDVSNFAIFSCTTSGCHSEATTDPHHTGVNGYVYSPTSCYSCHPTGQGD